MNKDIIIAIDGYSSCGKSSFAKAIAAKLGYVFIDTGAMYRAVTLFKLLENISDEELVGRLNEVFITFTFNADLGRSEIFLNGVNVDKDIRSTAVNDNVSAVAQIGAVREKLVDMQRSIGAHGGVVMDGRDIGTVVFPNAELKIFMTADPAIRAKRRYDEMGGAVSLQEVEKNIRERDYADEHRAESPLTKAADAYVLDNSHLTIAQQMTLLDGLLKSSTSRH